MTKVNVRVLFESLTDTLEPASGTIRLQAYAGANPRRRIDGADVVFSKAQIITVTNGEPDQEIDLVPTRGLFAWKWEIESGDRSFNRYTNVPSSPAEVDFEDLKDVDPLSFAPTQQNIAAWKIVVNEARQLRDEARVAAAESLASAAASAQSAEESEASAGDAADSATAAAGSASDAAGSATAAASSATLAGNRAAASDESATSSETSATSAAGSATSAFGYAVDAQNARNAAQTARTGSEAARTGAESARTGAEIARTAAESAASSVAKGQPNGTGSLNGSGRQPDSEVNANLTPQVLAGTFAPLDPGYDIVILAGQSNMSGRGVGYTAITDPVNPRVFQFKSQAPNANTIQPATEPLSMHDVPSGIGPGLQFARWYGARALKPGRKVLLVPVAHGGTGFEASTSAFFWKTTTTPASNNLYANMIAQTQAAIAAATAQLPGGRHEVVAALWCQGETDGDNAVTAATYLADFDALITGLRSSLSLPNLPFLVLTMVPEYLSTGTRAQINAVHRETPLRFARADVALGAAGNNLGDGNHYNAAGQRLNGKALFDAYERVTQGLSPYFETFRPAQVGSVSVTAGDGTLGISWVAAANATSYLVEYRPTGSTGAWSSTTVTGTSASLTGLTNGTSYDVRVTARNMGFSATPSATVTGSPAAYSGITLGVTTQPQIAHSVARVVNTAYTGPLIRVRRASDNAETDIAASGGVLAASALTAFAGGGDVFVKTIYDQSQRGGRDVTHATASKQPKIVSAGTILMSGGKPCAVFDGTDDVLFGTTAPVYAAGSATSMLVVSAATPSAQKRVWAESASSVSYDQYGLSQPDNIAAGGLSRARPLVTTQIDASSTTWQGSLASFDGTIHQLSATDTGSAMAQWRDGATDLASAGYTRSGSRITSDRFAIGGVVRNGSEANFAMSFSELVLFGAVLGTSDRQTAEANQKSHYGTP